MASAERAVNAILKAASGVTAIVGTRIYGGRPTQDAPRSGADLLPYVRYWREGTEYPERRMGGDYAHRTALLTLEVWAKEYDDMKALADAVETALDNYDGTIGGVTALDVEPSDRFDVPVVDDGAVEQQHYRVTI